MTLTVSLDELRRRAEASASGTAVFGEELLKRIARDDGPAGEAMRAICPTDVIPAMGQLVPVADHVGAVLTSIGTLWPDVAEAAGRARGELRAVVALVEDDTIQLGVRLCGQREDATATREILEQTIRQREHRAELLANELTALVDETRRRYKRSGRKIPTDLANQLVRAEHTLGIPFAGSAP